MKALPKKFFDVPAVELARKLLGQVLIHKSSGVVCGGRIVETEAYTGLGDPASHAARGPTPRAKIMFGPSGVAYVYFTYGCHHCVNVVAGPGAEPGAVLIRALEPTIGLAGMIKRRKKNKVEDLCSGPGKLCQAMGIDLSQNGWDLRNSDLKIVAGAALSDAQVASGPRIGISKATDLPWRFYEKGSRFYSARSAVHKTV